jgi:septal ring factor EnvC (AmiA/AmiB activator)
LRNIAYFDHFDLEFALGKAFQEDSDKAEELISNHSSYFVKYGSVYSLNNKIRARLDEFNRIIDGTKYAHKKKLIEGIWDEYAGNIQRKIDHLKIDIAKYRDRIGQFRRQQDENAQRIEALKSDYLKSENELIVRRRELDNATKKRKITPVIVLAFISVVFFIIGMAVGHVMADGETNGVLYLIRNALYSAGAVSGLMFLYHLGRLIFMLGRKGEYNHIVDRIEQIEQSRSAREKEMDEIRREVESGNPEIDKMERKIGDLENEIDELESMLDKPFIDRSGQG